MFFQKHQVVKLEMFFDELWRAQHEFKSKINLKKHASNDFTR